VSIMKKLFYIILVIICTTVLTSTVLAATNTEAREKIVNILKGRMKNDVKIEKIEELEEKEYDLDNIAVAIQLGERFEKDEEVVLKDIKENEKPEKLFAKYQEKEEQKYYITGADALNLVNEGYTFTELRLLQSYMIFNECKINKALNDKGNKTSKTLLDDFHKENESKVEEQQATHSDLVVVEDEEVYLLPVEDWMLQLFKEGYSVFEVVQIDNYAGNYEYVMNNIRLEQIISKYKEVGSFIALKETLDNMVDLNIGSFEDSKNNNKELLQSEE